MLPATEGVPFAPSAACSARYCWSAVQFAGWEISSYGRVRTVEVPVPVSVTK